MSVLPHSEQKNSHQKLNKKYKFDEEQNWYNRRWTIRENDGTSRKKHGIYRHCS